MAKEIYIKPKTIKAMVNKKISQAADKTPIGQMGLAVIKRAVKDIGTRNESPDCWFDGSLDESCEFSGVDMSYVIRLLRGYNLLEQHNVLH